MSLGDLDLTRIGAAGLRVYCHVCQVGLDFDETEDPEPLIGFLDAHEHRVIRLEGASANAHADDR